MQYFRQNDFPFFRKNTFPYTNEKENEDVFWIGIYSDAPF
jgi:hypothetical protein